MKSIKRILAIILALVMVFTTALGTFSVSAASGVTCTENTVVVDDDFAGQKDGATVTATVAGKEYTGKMGTTAFATLKDAYDAVATDGSIYVAAGVYTETLAIDKSVHFYGNKKGINPNNALDASQSAGGRAATGAEETILQNTLIYYKKLDATEIVSGILKLTINGFAITGDSAIYLRGDRYSGSNIDVSYNVFDIINENVYDKVGITEKDFSAIQAGAETDYNFFAQAVSIEFNRFERVGYTGKGRTSVNGIKTAWARVLTVNGNYIANVAGDGFAIGQLQDTTTVTNNYVYNVGKTHVYNNIGGEVEISDNVFDTVGGKNAEGQWALGVYATASSPNYSTVWLKDAKSVLIYGNTFKNLGNALYLRGQARDQAVISNQAPVGAQVYDNVFIPASEDDCLFLTLQNSDDSYAPKVYDNYTAGQNPQKLTNMVKCDEFATIDFGKYWLDEQCTKSSEVLSVLALTNTVGISFANAKIQVAPISKIAADIPNAIAELELGLEVAEGAYYVLYEDAECTKPIANNLVTLKVGSNTIYAKVFYEKYSTVYTVNLTRKEYYSMLLDPNELIVSGDFAQYSYGQTVYVQVGNSWCRAIVGYSAFADIVSAIDAAQKGMVINLTPGVYGDVITFAKGVTFKGPKAGINPTDMSDPEYGRNPQRANMAEEAVFTNAMEFVQGVDGISFDGITMTADAQVHFDDNGRFVVNGMKFSNTIFIDINKNSGVFYRMALKGLQNTMSNIVYTFNRFEGVYGNDVGQWSGASNAYFEGNVFHNLSSRCFFGVVDGSATDVLTFKDNIFYNYTGHIDFGGAGGTPHVNSSMHLVGNRFINCTSSYLVYVRNLESGVSFKVENNRFEGTTKGRMTVSAKAGFTGQTISINNNYFGSGVTELLDNSLESMADCTYNYYANGLSNISATKANFAPYYIDEAMTILSGDYQLLSVNAPSKALFNAANKTVTYNSDTIQENVVFDFNVSADAQYELFADKACTIPCADNVVELLGQTTVAYVKVSTADGQLSQIYTIQITQPKNNKAEIKGIDVAGSTWVNQGADRFSCTLPNNFVNGSLVPLTSAGATVALYEADDAELKNPINYMDVTIPVGQTAYQIKVTSEDGSTSKLYTVVFNRQKSSDCYLLGVSGEQEFTVEGNTLTVIYPFEVEKVIPELEVSEGASYTFYKDIGGNIVMTGETQLKIGENKVFVKVIAEDGTEQMYTVVIVRQDRSSENSILVSSFPEFTNKEAELNEDVTGTLLGLKYISGNTIYLQPKNYIESIMDTIQVSAGASYDIFKGYDFAADRPIGAAVSTSAAPKQISLTEGQNVFYVRVTAANGATAIKQLIVENIIKNTEAKIVDIPDFVVERDGNSIAATKTEAATEVAIKVSARASVKVFADHKKNVEVASSMTAEDTCTLSSVPKQTYVKYYIDVTSQTGVKESYVVTFTIGNNTDKFSDISGHWAANYINQAYKMGITSGNSSEDGVRTFNPNGKATRQEVAIFICNLLGIDYANYADTKLPYKDAASISDWAANAVKAVTKLGIFSGDGTKFNPHNAITRQEFMIVMVRACALDTSVGKASHIASFKDKDKIASWANVYVCTAVAYNIVSGDDKGNLNPTNSVTRAEIAKMMVCAEEYAR